MFVIVLLINVFYFFMKLVGKNGGNLPGMIAYRLNPYCLKWFKIDCPVIAVTGTNR